MNCSTHHLTGHRSRMSYTRTAFLVALAIPRVAALAQDNAQGARICLMPTSVQMVSGSTDAAVTAVRATFSSFLTGPSLGVVELKARLQSQAREEAKQANCPYVLITSLKQERKTDRGILRRATSGAIEAGAGQVIGSARSTEARIAAGAASQAAAAVREVSYSFKTKDEVELKYRLESATGAVLLDKTEKRTAKSDGEDVLTPLVERASEAIAAQVTKGSK
jgi:hypothetical protein